MVCPPSQSRDTLHVVSEQMTEVPLGAVPKPYIVHKAKGQHYEIEFECYYDSINTLMKAIRRVYDVTQKNGTDAYTQFELNVDSFFKDLRDNHVFDKR